MGYIKINQDKVNKEVAEQLKKLCPFNAFEYEDAYLSINAACKLCKMCVKKGPLGVCEFVETKKKTIERTDYKGITVYIQQKHNKAHPVSWELVGKALELAKKTNEEVFAIVIGDDVTKIAEEALEYGVNKVFVYQDKAFREFNTELYTNVIERFYEEYQVNVILFGGTAEGRSFAPKVAARLRTGLTADCTVLDIKENGDLIQIRPAFGGNIMAKIITPNNRPQMATIRYKMFDAPKKIAPIGKIINKEIKNISLETKIKIINEKRFQEAKDISDAEVIIACGRGFKKEKDLELIEPLVNRLNAEIACTRPLIEKGWFDAKKQIGLSGRTVKPKIIINLGISGSVQYIEGMKDSELIISINKDLNNKLFDISHYAIQADIYEIIPRINQVLENI